MVEAFRAAALATISIACKNNRGRRGRVGPCLVGFHPRIQFRIERIVGRSGRFLRIGFSLGADTHRLGFEPGPLQLLLGAGGPRLFGRDRFGDQLFTAGFRFQLPGRRFIRVHLLSVALSLDFSASGRAKYAGIGERGTLYSGQAGLDSMHATAATDSYLIGHFIGFTAGLVITVLLLVLTVRAARLPGTPVANIMLALCSLIWNLGGLTHVITLALGLPQECRLSLVALAVQFSSAAVWPIPMLAIWRDFAMLPWQRIGSRILQLFAVLNAAVIVLSFWSTTMLGVTLLPVGIAKEFTSYNGSALMALAAIVLLRGRLTSRAVWFSLVIALFGVFGTTFAILIQKNFNLSEELNAALGVMSVQSVLLVLLGGFFLFARFRFADLFIRYSLRILLASLLAVILVLITNGPFVSRLANLTAFPGAVYFFSASALAALLLLPFALLDRILSIVVNRWILHAPDYRDAARQLGERLRRLHFESEITAVVEETTRNTLELEEVRSIGLDRLPGSLWPGEIQDSEIVELDCADPLRHLLQLPAVELLVPVRAGGEVTSVLAISPGPARRGLVTHEVNYLRNVAAQFGSRLDSLRLERGMIERQSREALLLQQVAEAELRALRAQINPHFLFNSLNSIANLIMTNPGRAEAMTLRLARVFRYLLAHSSRPLTSIREEIDFLRSYLEIEEARFGHRLRVEIDVAPEVALERIPSLILQPLVENALKHSLAPKPEPGHLWVSARAQGDHICLKVEDDGIGVVALAQMNGSRSSSRALDTRGQSTGIGLTNVAQRLTTLYQDQAHISLEPRETGGTRVTVLVPRSAGLERHEEPHN
jgi:two-component system LytT family sensor kinase